MRMVSKNIALGEPITDIRDILRLASERKSVIWKLRLSYFVRPASFFLGWPLIQVMNAKLFYSVKINE